MAPPSYKLYTPEASFRAFATLIAAEFNGIDVEVVVPDDLAAAVAKSPIGKLPLLECQTDANESPTIIFSSHSMARYMAGVRRDTGLLGNGSAEAAAAVDAWMDYCAHNIELPACIWWYPVAGYMPSSQPAYEKAKVDLTRALAHLETHLQSKKAAASSANYYLVGASLTLADIVVVTTLLYPMKLVMDPAYRTAFPALVQWFEHCVALPDFVTVVGQTALCPRELPAKK